MTQPMPARVGPITLIAEFCQNHNGEFDVLARMIEAAADNGATHGKMQTIYAREVTFRPQFEAGLEVDGIIHSIQRPYQAEYDRLKGLEISAQQTTRFIRLCEDVGLVPVTTCFTRAQAKPLAELGFKTIKIASYDCASFPMLRELAALFPEIIVSTGATYDDEIEHAARCLKGKNFAFLHCVTIYPTPLDQMHLARMGYLRELAPRVGFSDHSLVARDGLTGAKVAIHLGAEIIERHFTILAADQSRDGPVSITPGMLKDLAEFARSDPKDRLARLDEQHAGWRAAIGLRDRRLSEAELLNRNYYRGRFASPRLDSRDGRRMIFNWEDVPLPS